MAPRKNAALAEYDYKVVSVEKTEPPEGVDGGLFTGWQP
jgi:hypothetical protein